MYLKINDHVTFLQSVEHEVEFILDKNGKDVNSDADSYKINARDFFVPTQVNFYVISKVLCLWSSSQQENIFLKKELYN